MVDEERPVTRRELEQGIASLRLVIDERDRLYKERDEAQRAYNERHNDLARKMVDQNKGTVPRPEIDARFHAIEEKVTELRTAIATGGGAALGGRAVKDETRANVAMIVGLLALVATLAAAVARWMKLGG